MRKFFLALGLLAAASWSQTPGYHRLPITLSFSNYGNGGAVSVAETRDLAGKVKSVVWIKKAGDSVALLPNTVTRLWWVCTPQFDSLGIAAFNPDASGNPPKVDLDNYKKDLLLKATLPSSDSLVLDTSKVTGETWSYQFSWDGDSLHLNGITRKTSDLPYGYHRLPITLTFANYGNGGAVSVAETRDLAGKVLNVVWIKKAGDSVVLAPKTITKLYWVCTPQFDSLGLAAFNPDALGNAPKIDLSTYKKDLLLTGSLPSSDSLVPNSNVEISETWNYSFFWTGDSVHLNSSTRDYARTASVQTVSARAATAVQHSGSMVRLDLSGTTQIDLLSASGRILASRQVNGHGVTSVDLGLVPAPGSLLSIRSEGQAPKLQIILPSR